MFFYRAMRRGTNVHALMSMKEETVNSLFGALGSQVSVSVRVKLRVCTRTCM